MNLAFIHLVYNKKHVEKILKLQVNSRIQKINLKN